VIAARQAQPVALAGVAAATLTGLLFAVTGMPGFLPFFGLSVLLAVLSMREALVMPASLLLCFFTLLMVVAPYLDLRLNVLTGRAPDLYACWPEPHLLLGIVTLVLAMLIVHLLTVDRRKVRLVHLVLRRVPRWQLVAVTALGILAELALFALGAGRHTAGFNATPGVGVLNMVKSLPELLIVVPAFAVVGSPRKRVYALVIAAILADSLATSLLSGRKEDLLISVAMMLVGFWSAVRRPAGFLLKTIVPVLAIALVFLPFMYRLRAHPAFNHLDHTSTPIDIVRDTLSGKYADRVNRSDFLQRLDLLEPTARYFGRTTVPLYDREDLWLLLACSVIPRFLWADKPAEQPTLGYRFSVQYGYASDYGITSIAFGYLVELHFLLGWAGVALLVLLPGALNSRAVLSLLRFGSVLPLFQLWVLFSFAVFVERTLVVGLITMLPYALLAVGCEGAVAWYRSLGGWMFPRSLAGRRPQAGDARTPAERPAQAARVARGMDTGPV
jgi:hypothetical protein